MTRLCDLDGCNEAHRARGLCAKHYNERNRKPNPTAEYTCPACGDTFTKERARANRYTRVYCSIACNTLHRLELTDGDPLKAARAARRKPRKRTVWPSCFIRPSVCSWCGRAYIARSSRSRNCSPACSKGADQARRQRGKAGRKRIRRVAVFQRDEYRCWMCSKECDPTARVPDLNAPTVDHLVPRSLGGSDETDNLGTACFSCNSRRGARWTTPTVASV